MRAASGLAPKLPLRQGGIASFFRAPPAAATAPLNVLAASSPATGGSDATATYAARTLATSAARTLATSAARALTASTTALVGSSAGAEQVRRIGSSSHTPRGTSAPQPHSPTRRPTRPTAPRPPD